MSVLFSLLLPTVFEKLIVVRNFILIIVYLERSSSEGVALVMLIEHQADGMLKFCSLDGNSTPQTIFLN